MSAASERVQSPNDEQEVPVPAPASEPSRPTEPRNPAPLASEALLSLEEDDDFDFHDTIPAPPWHEDEAEPAEIPPRPAR